MRKLKFRIYLAGYAKDLDYRKYTKEKYGEDIDFADPMDITDEEVQESIGNELSDIYIVMHDKKLIDSCDIVVAKVEKVTIGTTMEIMYAYMKGIPVFMISEDDKLLEYPWYKFHTMGSFYSIDECFDFILNRSEQ